MGGQSSGSQTRLWYQKGRVYARLAVCMWASVSVRRAALCAASVSSWGGTVRNARVLHVACRLANTARLRATSFAWGLRRPARFFALYVYYTGTVRGSLVCALPWPHDEHHEACGTQRATI